MREAGASGQSGFVTGKKRKAAKQGTSTHPDVGSNLGRSGEDSHLFALALKKVKPVPREAVRVDRDESRVVPLKLGERVCRAWVQRVSRLFIQDRGRRTGGKD